MTVRGGLLLDAPGYLYLNIQLKRIDVRLQSPRSVPELAPQPPLPAVL